MDAQDYFYFGQDQKSSFAISTNLCLFQGLGISLLLRISSGIFPIQGVLF